MIASSREIETDAARYRWDDGRLVSIHVIAEEWNSFSFSHGHPYQNPSLTVLRPVAIFPFRLKRALDVTSLRPHGMIGPRLIRSSNAFPYRLDSAYHQTHTTSGPALTFIKDPDSKQKNPVYLSCHSHSLIFSIPMLVECFAVNFSLRPITSNFPELHGDERGPSVSRKKAVEGRK